MGYDVKDVSFLRRYRPEFLASIISAFSIGFAYALWTATFKLSSIKAGEYPGMPKDQIDKQYQEALPSVILDSILMFLLITVVVFIPVLFIRFKISHNINVFSEFMSYLKSKKQ